MFPLVLLDLNNIFLQLVRMHRRSDRDSAELLALGVSSELVGLLSADEVHNLLESFLYLKEKHNKARTMVAPNA
jgi:hypothetical protein